MSDRALIPVSLPVSRVAPSPLPSRRGILLPVLLTCGAFLLLYVRSLITPVIYYDDFQILTQSWTWQRTWNGLWVPQNEHAMPLGRLFCFALEGLAGRLPMLPFLTCLVGPLALLLGLWLLYVFVRREMGHPFYAVLAIVLFAVTSVYHQAVWWFAASFAILAMDTMLLGLLAAQRWRQTGRGFYLALATLVCLLAPGWFALGILAGPMCCLYLANRQLTLPVRRFVAASGHRPVFGHQSAAHGGSNSSHRPLRRSHRRGSVPAGDGPGVHDTIAGRQSRARSHRRHRRRFAVVVHFRDSAGTRCRGHLVVAASARSSADAAGIGTDRQYLHAVLQCASAVGVRSNGRADLRALPSAAAPGSGSVLLRRSAGAGGPLVRIGRDGSAQRPAAASAVLADRSVFPDAVAARFAVRFADRLAAVRRIPRPASRAASHRGS